MPSHFGRLAAACCFALGVAAPCDALPVVRKTPGGPWVIQAGPDFSVPAGQAINWTIRVCNDTPGTISAEIADFLHAGECPGHELQTLECPPLADAGGLLLQCDDEATPPVTSPALHVQGIVIAPNGCAEVTFRTWVSLLAMPGERACNIGVYTTNAGTSGSSGQSSPPAGSGCSCVTVLPPLPTSLDLVLGAEVAEPPFAAGDPESDVVYRLTGINRSERAIEGRLLLPLPEGLELAETLACPPEATCALAGPGEIEVSGLRVDHGGGFDAAFRLVGNCAGLGAPPPCTQAWFEPVEDPSRRLLSSPDAGPAAATCFDVAVPDLVVTKAWSFDDRDADGVASAGDRVRFDIVTWNRGRATARSLSLLDALPAGFERRETGLDAVAVDARGTYASGRATWAFAELGPGSVVTSWLEATMLLDAVAPNVAQLGTAVLLACGGGSVASDDPHTAAAGDPTVVAGAGAPALRITKAVTFDDSDGDGQPTSGEMATYTMGVRNEGQAPARDLELVDRLAACLGDILGLRLDPPGAGIDLSTARELRLVEIGGPGGLTAGTLVTLEIDTQIVDASGCCNAAEATWTSGSAVSGDPRLLMPHQPTCLLPGAPALSLRKGVTVMDLDRNGRASTGDRLAYEIQVLNEGAAVTDLVLTDEFPAGLVIEAGGIGVDPPSLSWVLVPAPAGSFGAGRLRVAPIALGRGETARVLFEAALLPSALGETCNRATLLAAGAASHLSSEDITSGGATCLDIVSSEPPTLVVELRGSGPLDMGCAQPGEELDLAVEAGVLSGLPAEDVEIHLELEPHFDIVSLGGGTRTASGVAWTDIGRLEAGASALRSVRVQAACGEGISLGASALVSSSNSPNEPDVARSWPVAMPALSGVVNVVHDDVNGDSLLQPGESVLTWLALTESGGCEAVDVLVGLTIDPSLEMVELRQAGIESAGRVEWILPLVEPGATRIVELVLGLRSDAEPCLVPSLVPDASWPSSPGTICPQRSAWIGSPQLLAPAPCAGAGMDLLREDAFLSLDAVPSALRGLLDEAGGPDSCQPGVTTRIAPARVVLAGIGTSLDPGIVLRGEALPVGPGMRGQLVLYEVSDSCDSLRACKVDDDGIPGNGRESLRLGTAPCLP